jgi:NAD-dependent dihydropyrimidine dehydrogenase PreA subunit
MTYVITEPCIDLKDKTCVDECPVEAIFYEDDVPEQWAQFTTENVRFFD